MGVELCWHCPHVARRMHYQGWLPPLLQGTQQLTASQSVFLKDITVAFDKNKDLESLLFDDFFNKGIIPFSSLFTRF